MIKDLESEQILKKKFEENKNIYRLRFNLKREKEALSGWQISNFLNNLSGAYYKLELLKEISEYFQGNDEIRPEDIIIFDSSFSINTSYVELEKTSSLSLNNDKDFKRLFHLGNPFGMFPSTFIKNLEIGFKSLRMANNYLYENNIKKRISKDEMLALLLNTDINFFMQTLENNLRELIHFDESKKTEEAKKKIADKFSLFLADYKNELFEYEKNRSSIVDIKNRILNNEINYDFLDEKYKNYFLDFYEKFQDLSRPIVGIYNQKKREIKILCSSQLVKKNKGKNYLDVKKIEHSSPTSALIFMGITIIPCAIAALDAIYTEFKNKKSRDDEFKNFIEEQLNQFNKNRIKLKEYAEDKLGVIDNKIPIKAIEDKIKPISIEQNSKFSKALKEYGFNNLNTSIDISQD